MSDAGLVSILFTDLVGSTELASDVGDVVADELRRSHFVDLRSAIAATGGTEVKTIGDAIMVSYRGATDALAGAVAMQRAVERSNRQLDGRRLTMRVGVSAGDATFEDGDWFGTPVVEAARLCGEAEGNQILVSDLVRALAGTRSEYTVTPLGVRTLKGLPEPLAVCEVEWHVPRQPTSVSLPAFVDLAPTFPFAGRSSALETLLTAWKESAEGARRAVLVSGEPGIGKTRLVTELVRRALEAGTLVLWGRCDEELGTPFEPFAEALRHYAGAVPVERLQSELGPLGGELTRMLPDLAARAPGLNVPISGDAEDERHRLFEAVCDLLSQMSRTDPLILVLDDIHWSDKPSLLLLRHILRSASPMRLLVLATYRDTDLDRSHPLAEVLADLRREPGVVRLDLAGLDQSEVMELMEATAGHELDEPAAELAQAVQLETQGNPFFVGEVLRHLAESGSIVQVDGRWTSTLTLGQIGIPEGIREVVGRRLSLLSDAANKALAVAAVIGAQFDLATIEASGGPAGDELFDALDQAVGHGVIREIPGMVGRYSFAHALVRSSLYEELSTNRRVRMHARVGLALEARHARHLEEHLDELAYHFSEGALAGDPMKAVDYGRRAARRATAELAFESAVRHLEHAMVALELVDEVDDGERCDLQLALASALSDSADQRSREVVLSSVETARQLGDPERFCDGVLILCHHNSTDDRLDPELLALLEEALVMIGEAPSPRRALLLSALAVELQWGPEVERRMSLAGASLDLARAIGDEDALTTVLMRAWALLDGSTPYHDELERLNDEALQIARRRGDTFVEWEVLTNRGYLAGCRGDGAAFAANFESAAELTDGLRRPTVTWLMRNRMAALAAYRGDLTMAEQLATEAIELGRKADRTDQQIIGALGALLYPIRMGQGRIGELVEILESRVEGSPFATVWRVALAGALTETDRIDEARVHYQWLAEDGCARVAKDVEFSVTLCGLGRMAFRIQPDEVVLRDVYDRLLPFAGLFNWTGQALSDATDLGLGMTAAALGEHDLADRHLAAGIELCERAGARAFLARCHFDWARILLDRGDTEHGREQAELAIALGSELGMNGPQGVVPRARALLDGS